jgi:anti-sigma regulatory factor (Ser/Thr protein kinase)
MGVAEAGDIVEARLLPTPGSVLAMYTDGLIERRGQNIDEGIDLLGRVIATGVDTSSDRILRNVSEVIGAPDDDVALLLTTIGGAQTTFEVEIPAEPGTLPELRRRLRTWLLRRECSAAEAADVVLAVSEACNNAIEHAYRDREGTIALRVETDGASVRAVVEDQGSWQEPSAGDERGRGITLMRHLMTSAEIEPEANGTRVTLVLQLAVALETRRPAVPAAP